ncbi:MAG TPA: polysaccharide biosynthesis/export family protein [Terracidiphilus sp.]|jgi:polysaccharide export outer membrane protein
MKYVSLQALVLGMVIVFLGCQSGQAQSTGGEGASSDAGSGGKAHDENYMIGNDDLLAISVWKEPDLTKSVPVRSDGKISLPLVGELQAAGKTPLQLERDISEKLKNFITVPEVTVIVEKVNSRKFNILGEVSKPGSYPLTASTTIMDAIATAGGFRDFAKKSGVYVLRKTASGQEGRLKFNYKDFIKGKDVAQNIKIEPNDTIIVP